ncbi:uncharacterized protein LOC103486956 isoform X2 [Cucumis melo]|uniref:Uncharacterized protein LOC103486956 isoform X2 n=1 Tax=Cucumis melo TaxID=3656 RepID=A0A1S4DUR2_CUCME|nr:uncharacterized protein LOC103486956 isoform X2 [Cucumis melo]
MEAREMEEALKVLDSSLSQIKWRLKFPAKRRLQLDVLALCTGMRPVVMIDYGGKMPELQQRLCALLKLIQTELHIFENLKVMVIEDMIYLIHVQGLAEHVHSTLNSKLTLLLVDIEQDPPKMLVDAEKSSLGLQLKSIQKLFSSLFSQDETEGDPLPSVGETCVTDIRSSIHGISSQSSVIDLSNFLQHTEITLPTLNGLMLLENFIGKVWNEADIEDGFLDIQLYTFLTRTTYLRLLTIFLLSLFTSSDYQLTAFPPLTSHEVELCKLVVYLPNKGKKKKKKN